jgi:HlyD family secretion protein
MQTINSALILKHRWQFLGLVLVLAVLSVFAIRWWRGPLVIVETMVRRDFVQTVVASGHVESPHRIDIGAQITGTVIRVPVAEGQNVRAGDFLIELSSGELRAAEKQADVAVMQAQARLRQLREVQAPVAEQTLRQAQASLENARSVMRRNEELFKKGFIGEAAMEDSRKSLELADAQMRSAQKQVETTRTSGSDYAMAQAAVAEAQASAEAARARSRYALIRAPLGGTLIGRNVEVGDVVQPGKVLMTLSPMGRTQLVVQIDEKNLRLLAMGQKALASADAYPQQRFEAVLVYINPGVNVQTGAVEVKLDVPAPPPVLKQDMTVSVDIEVARIKNALTVSANTVRDIGGAAPWVVCVEGGHAVQRKVRLGLRGGGTIEVQEGLREGDVVVSMPETVPPGARVRAMLTPRV